MKVTLYQIVFELDNNHLMFRDLKFIKSASNNKVPAEIYENVYCGDLDVKTVEEVLYHFNVEYPKDFKGRTITTSDVVEISFPEYNEFFFCDACGFQKIEFDKEQAMFSITNHNFWQEQTIRYGSFNIVQCDDEGANITDCSKISLTRCSYSQSELGYKLSYWRNGDGHWTEKILGYHPKILLVRKKIPESLLYENQKEHLGRRRYEAFDYIEQWCKEVHIKYEYI